MRIAYLGLAAAVMLSACTKETGISEPAPQLEQGAIRIASMSNPGGVSPRSAGEEKSSGFSVTYEIGDPNEETIASRAYVKAGLTHEQESAVDFIDIWDVGYANDYTIAKFFYKKVDKSALEGPIDEGWSYLYKYYAPKQIFPSKYEMSPYTTCCANIGEGFINHQEEIELESDEDLIKAVSQLSYDNEDEMMPGGHLQLIGESNWDGSVQLMRLAAKIDVTVTVGDRPSRAGPPINPNDGEGTDPGGGPSRPNLSIVSIQLKNVARTFHMWGLMARNPVPAGVDNISSDYEMTEEDKSAHYMDYPAITGTDIGRIEGGDRFVWYVMPNFDDMNGSKNWSINSASKKTVANCPPTFFATHIFIEGIYNNKKFFASVCPGEDDYNNYAIRNNTWYKIKIHFSNTLDLTDPRLEFPDGKP